MSFLQIMFSFEGRLRRRDFWLGSIALWVGGWVVGSILSALLFPHFMVWSGPNGFAGYSWPVGGGYYWRGYGLVWLLGMWPGFALAVKRCHDRGQTGLWSLLLFVPVVNFFWWLINLGLLDGTPGPNEYGPSPKGIGGAAPAAA